MKQGIEHADSERGLKVADKRPEGNSVLLQQPTHPQASSALPAAGTADRGLVSTATQDAAALQKPWAKPLLGATGIAFRDYALPTTSGIHSRATSKCHCFFRFHRHFQGFCKDILTIFCGVKHTAFLERAKPYYYTMKAQAVGEGKFNISHISLMMSKVVPSVWSKYRPLSKKS